MKPEALVGGLLLISTVQLILVIFFTQYSGRVGWQGILVAAAVIPSGMMWLGYTFWDELLTAAVLALYFVRPKRSPAVERASGRRASLHVAVFAVTCWYFGSQAFRGAVLAESPLQVRWVMFFALIYFMSAVLRGQRQNMQRDTTLFAILGSTLAYFSFYLLHGTSGEFVRGVRWVDLQLVEWGTTAYAFFPIAAAAPAISISLSDSRPALRRLGWVTLGVIAFTSMYYDARIAMISTLAVVLMSAPSLGVKRSLRVAALVGALVVIAFNTVWRERTVDFVVEDLMTSGGAIFQEGPGGRDRNRQIMLMATVPAISEEWHTLLFGYGLRQGSFVIVPYIYDLYLDYLPTQAESLSETAYGLEAFSTIVVETGLVGLALIVANFVLAWIGLLRRRSSIWRIGSLSLALTFAWMFVINTFDILLFYMTIMPGGLIDLVGHSVSPPAEENAEAGVGSGNPSEALQRRR